MPAVSQLYVRSEENVRGPLRISEIRSLIEKGGLRGGFEVSVDGKRWLDARKVRGLLPREENPRHAAPAVHTPHPRSEILHLLGRIHRLSASLAITFYSFLALALLLSTSFVFWGFYRLVLAYAGGTSPLIAGFTVVAPACFLGAAFAHAAGNLFLRTRLGISESERQYLALYLPWNRVPEIWPSCLRRWLYSGDWLLEPEPSPQAPYIRAFVTGKHAASIQEEIALWTELCRGIDASAVPSARKASIRELAYVERLPQWIRDLDSGSTLKEIESRLGPPGRTWIANLVKRAALRSPFFAGIDPEKNLRDLEMEFHYRKLSEEREGLLVILRPRPHTAGSPPIELESTVAEVA